jgi:hypothetical protein
VEASSLLIPRLWKFLILTNKIWKPDKFWSLNSKNSGHPNGEDHHSLREYLCGVPRHSAPGRQLCHNAERSFCCRPGCPRGRRSCSTSARALECTTLSQKEFLTRFPDDSLSGIEGVLRMIHGVHEAMKQNKSKKGDRRLIKLLIGEIWHVTAKFFK